jgi:hypothetical protein
MALPLADQVRVANQLMRDNEAETGPITKAELLATVQATDAWIDANQAAWVASLPPAAASGLSATQKTWVFAYVLMKRIGALRTED